MYGPFYQIPRHIRLNIKFKINSKIWHMLAEPKLPPPVMCSECTVLAQESDRYRQERQPTLYVGKNISEV